MKHFLLVLLTIATVALFGCSVNDSNKSDDDESAPMGHASMKLRTPAGDCVMASMQIFDEDGNPAGHFDTDCDDISHQVPLRPGPYTAVPEPGYTCVASDSTGYVSCEFIETVPEPFVVVANEVTDVALRFRFFFENTDDQMVLFTIGGAEFDLDPPENEQLCGGNPACADGDICATVNNVGPDCYTICVLGGDPCADGLSCIAVGALEDQGPNAPANLCIIGVAGCDVPSSFHLCLPAPTPSPEVCNGVDDDLDGFADNGPGMLCVQGRQTVCSTVCSTLGLSLCDANCQPGACVPPSEVCDNGIDDDCNGDVDCLDIACVSDPACTTPNCIDLEMVDGDGDGYSVTVGCGPLDCNDQNAAIHPGATEVCNGLDDDCDGVVDEGCVDGTGGTSGVGGATGVGGTGTGGASGVGGATGVGGTAGTGGFTCQDIDGDGYSRTVGCGPLDCNDLNAAIHPGATEVCNGIDDNCVNGVDEGNVCGTGGASGAGGDTGTGGDSGLGGSGGSVDGLVEVTFVFTGPATYGGPTGTPYVGGDIDVRGMTNTMSWGMICSPGMDTDDSPTDLLCTTYLPENETLIFDIFMVVAGAPAGYIYSFDHACTPHGSHLEFEDQGVTEVYANGVLLPITLVPNPSFNDPDPATYCEADEMLTYNGSVNLPSAP